MNIESAGSKPIETSGIAPQQSRRENSPDHSVSATGGGNVATGGSATLHDRLGVYMAVLAVLISGIALGYEMSQSSSRSEIRQLQERNTQSLIAAAVAKSDAEANEAKVTARVSLDNVKTICAGLKANGVKNIDCH